MLLNQNYYQFIQKQTDEEDPKYKPYFDHTFTYITDILMIGNSIILLLFTLLKKHHQKLPTHGMLGNILRQNQVFFNQKLNNKTINDLFSFNKSLNQVKHSVISISQTSINDPNTIFFFDLKTLQSFSLLESDQQLNIKLGQNIITNVKNEL